MERQNLTNHKWSLHNEHLASSFLPQKKIKKNWQFDITWIEMKQSDKLVSSFHFAYP